MEFIVRPRAVRGVDMPARRTRAAGGQRTVPIGDGCGGTIDCGTCPPDLRRRRRAEPPAVRHLSPADRARPADAHLGPAGDGCGGC